MKRKTNHGMEQKRASRIGLCVGLVLLFCMLGIAPALASVLELPSSLKEIADEAFMNDTSITSVVIPDGTTSIGARAFAGCGNLEMVTIPSTVESISEDAFKGCVGMYVAAQENSYAYNWCQEHGISVNQPMIDPTDYTFALLEDGTCEITGYTGEERNLELPWCNAEKVRVTRIADEAFWFNSNITRVKIPEGVKEIGKEAFYFCDQMKELSLPEGVLKIEEMAFYSCDLLEEIHIPDSVEEMGEYAFGGCEALRKINYPVNWRITTGYCSPFAASEKLTTFEIPEGVTSIPENAFYWCDKLTDIQLPDSLTSIGDYAFAECAALSSIEFPDSIKSLGMGIFMHSGLQSITLPASLESFYRSFSESDNLERVFFSEGIKLIDSYAFNYCRKLEQIEFVNSITEIGDGAFYECTGLTGNLVIPESVERIGESAFYECTSLIGDLVIPEKVKRIEAQAFFDCGFDGNITLPDGITSIGYMAFAFCKFDGTLIIPDSVINIDEGAFHDCYYLDSLVLSNQMTSIEESTFAASGFAGNLYIPEGISIIEDTAFKYCDHLQAVYIPSSVLWIGMSAFPNVTIYGVSGSYAETYAAESGIAFVADGMPTVDMSIDVTDNCVQVYVTAENAPGSYRYQYELLFNDKTVSVSELTLSTQYSFCLNEVGTGTIRLCVRDITDDSFIMYREEEFYIENVPVYEGAIVVTPSVTMAEVGECVTFTINAPDAYKVRLLVDNIAYEEYIMQADEIQVERVFTLDGERAVQFQRWDGENWGAISEVHMLTITSQGKLAKPVFESLGTISLNQAINLNWTTVENADSYMVYLSYNDMELWRTEEPITDTTVEIPGDNFAFPGDYVVLVVAIGNGYSQNEYGQVVTVMQKEYVLSLDTPADGGTYVVGDRFECNISNPDAGYVVLQITPPDGIPVLVPSDGAVADTEIYLGYLPKELGTYVVQAFVFETERDVYHTAFAANKSNTVTLKVNGSDIYDNHLGNGAACQPIADTYTVSVKTNNAVDQVTFHGGDDIQREMVFVNEVDYVRYFTETVSGLLEGFHKYYFSALDKETGSVHEGTFGFYIYTLQDAQTLYPAYHGLKLLKYPDEDAEEVSSLMLTDSVTLIGTYGDYCYVEDVNYMRGFALKDDLNTTYGSIWDELEIAIATPSVNSQAYVDETYHEYIADDHAFAITWCCNQILTERMKYRVDLYEISGGVRGNCQTFITSGSVVSIASDIMKPNQYYEIEVSVVSADDNNHRFGSAAVFSNFYMCANYEEYLGWLVPGYDLLQMIDGSVDLTNQICGFFNGETVEFANNTTSGSVYARGVTYNVAELKGYVNNGALKAYVGATGDAVTTAGLTNTRALFIADKIARQYSNRSSRVLSLDWLKNILEAVGIGKDFINTLMESNYIKDMIVRTYDDGTVFIFYDADRFNEIITEMGKDPKNIIGGLQHALNAGVAIANIIDDSIAYWNADYNVLYDIAFALRCSNDDVLKKTAEILMEMNTMEGCIASAVTSNGLRLAETYIREVGGKLLKEVLDMVNPGLYLGIRIGLTANDVLFGINGTYAAACEASWCIDAAVAFRETYNAKYKQFKKDNSLYYDMCRFTQAYTDMIACGARGWGNFYETHNNTLANQFLSLIGGDKGYDRAIASCNSLANIVRTDIKTNLLSYYDELDGEGMLKPSWFKN